MTQKTHLKKHTNNVVAAALTMDLVIANKKAPTEIQLTPVGFFRAKDGRPVDLPDGWYIDEKVAQDVIDWNYKNDRVIDYEHQTLLSDENGKPAPAAGWFSELQWRESGLWAVNVKWTPAAEKMIENGEYRFISPVFSYDPKTGHVLDVIMSAITNNPALDGMAALTNLKSNQFTNREEDEMKISLLDIVSALGLPEDTTAEQALVALTDLKAAKAEADVNVAALTAQAKVDPAKYVPIDVVKGMQADLAALTAQSKSDQVVALVDQSIANKTLLPAQKAWATELGKSNLDALTDFVALSTPVAALSGQQALPGHDSQSRAGKLDDDQRAIAKAFGKTEGEFLAALKLEKGE